jgi:hypothetical protein
MQTVSVRFFFSLPLLLARTMEIWRSTDESNGKRRLIAVLYMVTEGNVPVFHKIDEF